MAWGARWGLKQEFSDIATDAKFGLNGLGSPFGIEPVKQLAGEFCFLWLNGLGSPLGIPTKIQGEGKNRKRAHKSSPKEELWEQGSHIQRSDQ